MTRYICIHGHFYQPPRENPWLEDVELQDSAYPHHDWNEKITEQCYSQNAASRILGADKKIIDIVNNYSKISFDFGPTLLSWLQKHAPDVYQRVLEADRIAGQTFSGHGPAIAHAYNHIIMPLANRRDKITQIIWGIHDFQSRFKRLPEGMWLPETAVDIETLDLLAEHDIKFTILAPHQAAKVKKINEPNWKDVDQEHLDTTQPYLCNLSSGRSISIFFYNGAISQEAAYGKLLRSGELLARKLLEPLHEQSDQPRLVNIATDGETYGHHHRHSDMALAYCIDHIQSNNLAKITVYGEYLEKFPPTSEVQIHENTSWSCPHGIERWRSNCGCHTGRHPAGKQQYRAPLRKAMDWLAEQLAAVYEQKMAEHTPDPWLVRNKYITVINDRNIQNVEKFLAAYFDGTPSYHEKVLLLKLLEMQRHCLLMYTSCGWFFDDICGIETVQIMQFAARSMQLAQEVAGRDFAPDFKNILEEAPTNAKEYPTGKDTYEGLVEPSGVDLNRVGGHLAISSLFEQYPDNIDVYCYSANIEQYDRLEAGIQVLATGKATIQSNIVLEKHPVDFAVLHFGTHNLIGAVNARMSDTAFAKMQKKLKNAFLRGNTTEVMRLMNVSFGGTSYSLWHLFRDEQRRILYKLLQATWEEVEASFRHIYEHNYSVMQVMRSMNIPLPKALSTPAEFILHEDLCRIIRDQPIDLDRLRSLTEEAGRLSLQLDEATLRFEISRKINRLMGEFQSQPENVELLRTIEKTLDITRTIISKLDLQTAQNNLFAVGRQNFPHMKKKADAQSRFAQEWINQFLRLADKLGVKIE